MKIEIDDDLSDTIVCASLKEHIKYCKHNIKNLKQLTDKKPFQEDDLADNTKTLAALEIVHDYYGGNL